jgi:hypothetical protein
LGQYDYYCFMEDDLILRDPLFFNKLRWFTRQTGDQNLLQPNRFELSSRARFPKVFIDGDIAPRATAAFQNVGEQSQLTGSVMGTEIVFRRALNPHAGCFFLNGAQMAHWSRQAHFLDRDTRFVGPLESAASLGVMKSFRVYKPARQHAGFLEIQHAGTSYLDLLGTTVGVGPELSARSLVPPAAPPAPAAPAAAASGQQGAPAP